MRLKRNLFVSFIAIVTICTFLIVPSFAAQQEPINHVLNEVRTFAGNGKGDLKNGPLTDAKFDTPSSFVKLTNGNIIVADSNNQVIRQITKSEVTTLAGSPFLIDGDIAFQGSFLDGKNLEAGFHEPGGLAIANDGSIIVADVANHAIRKISMDGSVTTIAGDGVMGFKDGEVENARFYAPQDVAVDSLGNIYVADTLNHVIRKISQNGIVSTITKPSSRIVEYTQGMPDFAGDFADGALQDAMFNEPSALLIDQHDNLYVADRGNQRIRYIDFSKNVVSTVAGSGELSTNQYYVEGGFVDGPATSAQFSSPEGMVLLDDSTLLIADRKNHTIRQLKNGVVSTVTGIAGDYGNTNGVIQYAQFNEPVDVLVQEDGALLVLEAGNHQIRIIASYDTFLSQPFSKELEVLVNGKVLDENAKMIESRTLLPLRAIGEELGLTVHYDQKSGKITLSNETTTFVFKVNSKTVQINRSGVKTSYSLDVTATVLDGSTYIPVRFIAEQLQLHVAWDAALNNVVIRNKTFN
ncbi:MAG TPA: stalk domain-containing protein [Ureibacillus sp.]|nr:stalk domain-containing protein [Ureibacillus sp.]